jgi:hypothetical protein
MKRDFVNFSIDDFGMSLLLVRKWPAIVHSSGASPSAKSFDQLTKELKRADPRALQDEKSFWPSLVEVILENPDNDALDFAVFSDPARSKPRF